MVLNNQWTKGTKPDFWDGKAALRIKETIKSILEK
jgi:hypothetical protein